MPLPRPDAGGAGPPAAPGGQRLAAPACAGRAWLAEIADAIARLRHRPLAAWRWSSPRAS
ncbi:hypothetical protein G5V59_00990 [Nocardioides sp. W3-2-3]|uniref:hypothetical protein n=1 Tax=Nocardioides convexus TaxID=2712224 RepID=UPI002418A865|nr:hypothetical protein [Nocardioides convexus]NGZ99487.1 hypothetical protein [Nocardioides convexus]